MADDKSFKELIAESKRTNKLLEQQMASEDKGSKLGASIKNAAGEIINDRLISRTAKREADETQAAIKQSAADTLEQNEEKARAVWLQDERVDETYNSAFSEMLTYMMEDPRHITPCTHLLFIAKNIERIGDHVTNIAEMISFVVTGSPIDAERPKGDRTPFETDPTFSAIGNNPKKVK